MLVMEKRYGIGVLILLAWGVLLQGQVAKSEKAFLQLKPQQSDIKIDIVSPEIKILTPSFDKNNIYKTSEPEISIIGVVSDDSEIQSVVVNTEFQKTTDNGEFVKRVTLFPGENSIVIGAMDVNKNYSEKRLMINYTPVVVSLAEQVREKSVYYALIIGIDYYADPALNNLSNAVGDAQRIYDELIKDYTFEEDNIQFLRNAKREEIIYALDNLARYVTPDDNVLIYYAGHGRFDDEANIGYWLPSNARRISTADWFGNSQLVDYLKKIKSRHTLLITDACFSGSIFQTRAAFSDASPAIERLYELPSRKAMTSGTLTEVPDESVFAKYLVERLEENKSQYFSAEQLFSSLRIAVINNSDVIPQYGEIRNVGDQGGDFIFIRK